ncbi:MAG: hypothetical protein NZ879_01940 [Archaeoglobaceae archaeon]|nr:hypothetical protein [Archaeoglobaceae archaeon]MDW8117725.1 hypothetical protein [Archaeoglobaceae archaeon]
MGRWILALIVLLISVIVSLSACLGSGVSGTYECTKSGTGFPTFSKGDTVEFKSNGEVIYRSHLGGPSILGEYEVKGDKISIKVTLFGTKISLDGRVEGNKIRMDDGAILEKE